MSKVLIIEDELSTARPVQEALKINGIDAEIAQNGLQGLEMLKQDNYDLVLLDSENVVCSRSVANRAYLTNQRSKNRKVIMHHTQGVWGSSP